MVINAELWGALEDLQVTWNLGLKQVVLEMDNVAAIQFIQIFSTEHHHSVELQAIKELLQLF